jgi:hypothetical protein
VIVSNNEKVSCKVHQNKEMLEVPVCGYAATSLRVNWKQKRYYIRPARELVSKQLSWLFQMKVDRPRKFWATTGWAIPIQRTALDETIFYPSSKRTCLKTAVQKIPAQNQAEERIDEADLFRWRVDDAERITANGIMISISKQHAVANNMWKRAMEWEIGVMTDKCGESL